MVIVLCGFLGGLVFSIVYMTFLRYFAGCMAWVTVISFNVILIALTLYCALKGGLIGADEVGVSYGGSSTSVSLTSRCVRPCGPEHSVTRWEPCRPVHTPGVLPLPNTQ